MEIVAVTRRPAFEPSVYVLLRQTGAWRSPGYECYCISPAPALKPSWGVRPDYQSAYESPEERRWSVEVEASAAEEIKRLLEPIELRPFAKNNAMGIDGVTYEILTECAYLTWWVSPPAGWESAEQVVARLLELAGVPYAY